MMDKLTVVAVAHLFIILSASSGVFAQGNMEQRDSVRQLRDNRNMDIITTCPRADVNILSCDVTDMQERRLTTGNGEYLRRFEIIINTCNSSLSPVFVFSNNTMKRSDELRCSTKIPLGQLNIMFDLKIFINQSTNFTVIDTAISAWQGGEDIELFRRTNLILSGQVPFSDCIAEGGLIRPPFQCSVQSAGVTINSFSALSTASVAIAIALVHVMIIMTLS